MKKYFIVCLILVLLNLNLTNVNANESLEVKSDKDRFTTPILDKYSGEIVGERLYKVEKVSEYLEDDVKIIKIKARVESTKFEKDETEVSTVTDILEFRDGNLTKLNEDAITEETNEPLVSLSVFQSKRVLMLGNIYKQGEISMEEYRKAAKEIATTIMIENDNIDGFYDAFHSKKLHNAIGYEKRASGYYVYAGKMLRRDNLNSFMLDPKGVQANSKTSRIVYDSSFINSFVDKADDVWNARTELLAEGVVLMGILGVTALTFATIVGALGGAGSAAVVAVRMNVISSGAHVKIQSAYAQLWR
ncbi:MULTISPECIES: hypothetical protein [Sporosarcina]|uniref:hypothetical protein n=1 Tax=Sporosarcina TaxID=1569 RepID=UPI00058E3929|nr:MULTISPECIES: hypothetical protein [Sporosarcina]WJY26761.1 hypothetical protein QWT68_11965 [Sporosarcina sp. 0.2-SM1T-5]